MNEKHQTPRPKVPSPQSTPEPSGGHGASPSTTETRASAARRHPHSIAGHARKSMQS